MRSDFGRIVEIGRGVLTLRYNGKHLLLVQGKRERVKRIAATGLMGCKVVLMVKVLSAAKQQRAEER
jgi:hypothetical protein